MKSWKLACVAIGALCTSLGVLTTGCGDDDGGVIPRDGSTIPDVITPPGPDTGIPPTDGGDGGGPCDFAVFVTNLITTQTTATSVPSTNLGEACTDKQDPTQFAPLFP